MEVRRYDRSYDDAVYRLWSGSGVKQGFVPLQRDEFDRLLLENIHFSSDYAFLLIKEACVCGFICGCGEEERPETKDLGLFSCLLLEEGYDTEENAGILIQALENAFQKNGKKKIVSSYMNPIRLPWILPETKGRQHNNAPGIAIDTPLYQWMMRAGCRDRARECAMYLDLMEFEMPDWIAQKEKKAASEGYYVEWYDAGRHHKLKEMVDSMHNSMWSEEIPYAAEHINMLVAVKDGCVAGFTGPVYPEKSTRGYFAGIAVAQEHEKHGLGTLLFYRLCMEEKKAGSRYMSLFTGADNHAGSIYKGAGFQVKRIFALVEKSLEGQDVRRNFDGTK